MTYIGKNGQTRKTRQAFLFKYIHKGTIFHSIIAKEDHSKLYIIYLHYN